MHEKTTTDEKTTTSSLNNTFSAMDSSNKDQWMAIGHETSKNQPRVAQSILTMLNSLKDIVDGFSVDQLTHSLQTATRAEEDKAEPQMIVAALCHDIGKAISVANHAQIAAEILRPYVDEDVYNVIRTHQEFQGRHYFEYFGGNPDAREDYRDEAWFSTGETFADKWDQNSFDPTYPTQPLSHFEPLIRQTFAKPKRSFG